MLRLAKCHDIEITCALLERALVDSGLPAWRWLFADWALSALPRLPRFSRYRPPSRRKLSISSRSFPMRICSISVRPSTPLHRGETHPMRPNTAISRFALEASMGRSRRRRVLHPAEGTRKCNWAKVTLTWTPMEIIPRISQSLSFDRFHFSTCYAHSARDKK